jgi:hypothetical protein
VTALLSTAERDRLIAILGMLGSDFDGERASAALMASRLLKNAGLVWADVVVVPQTGPRREPPRSEPPRPDRSEPFGGRDWRELVARCAEFPRYLDQWQMEFLGGLGRFPRLSPKQATKLNEIVGRLQAAGCRV